MSTNMREIIVPYLAAQGLSQKQFAAAIAEVLPNSSNGRQIPIDTIESRLSECVNEKKKGLDYFFGDPHRRVAMIAALGDVGAAAAERADERARSDGKARVVVDLATLAEHTDTARIFEQLQSLLLGRPEFVPVALVVTAKQRDDLPNRVQASIDAGVVTLEVWDGDSSDRISEIAAHDTLVITHVARGGEAFRHWVALDYDQNTKKVSFTPTDALERFVTGTLEALPSPRLALARLVDGADEPEVIPGGSYARRLMLALVAGSADSGHRSMTPARRIGLARALGVEAGATQREWDASLELRLAPVTLYEGSAAFESERAIAEFCSGHSAVIRNVRGDGRTVRTLLINPSERVLAELGHDEARESIQVDAVRRERLDAFVLDAVRTSADDREEDPTLGRLAQSHRSDADARDLGVLDHLRVAVVAHYRRTAREQRRPRDAVVELERALALTSLQPRTRLIPPGSVLRNGACLLRVQRFAEMGEPLYAADAVETVEVSREAPNVAFSIHQAPSEPVAPLGSDSTLWVDEILAALVESPVGFVAAMESRPLADAGRSGYATTTGEPFRRRLSPELFERADRLYAIARVRCAHALAQREVIDLGHGRALIAMQGGLYIEVAARSREATRPAQPSVSLDVASRVELSRDGTAIVSVGIEIDALECAVPILQATSAGYGRTTTTLGPLVPRGIRWTLPDAYVDVTFVGSGLGASIDSSSAVPAASHGADVLFAKQRHDEEERQRALDDDD